MDALQAAVLRVNAISKRMNELGTDPDPPPKEEPLKMTENVKQLGQAARALFRRS